MTFGQLSGPPATAKQVQELLALLQAAGHADFRDARGPMGFTQRQAGGKFSRDEADAFIEQLQHEAERAEAQAAVLNASTPSDPAPAAAPRSAARPKAKTAAADAALAKVSTEALAAELQRRGWIVVEP